MQLITPPKYHVSIPWPVSLSMPCARGQLLPVSILATADTLIVTGSIPDDGRWAVEVGVDQDGDFIADPEESWTFGTTLSFVQSGRQLWQTIAITTKVPTAARLWRLRKVA